MNFTVKLKHHILWIFFLQIMADFSIFFNIPVARQVIVFFYFTFIPGYIIVKILKFHFELLEMIILSIGFSLAFLMFFGLVLNELSLIIGILKPLSTIPLLLMLNSIVLLCAIFAFVKSSKVCKLPDNVSLGIMGWFLLLVMPIVLSIVGTMFIEVYGDNRVLLAMICAIVLVTSTVVLKEKAKSEIYAFTVFIIGISLLYHFSLISNYLCTFGSDASGEHFVFQYTQLNGCWTSSPPTYWGTGLIRLNNMLSITILSTAYSNLLNLDSAWVFKLVFPLIFTFVPLSLYQIWAEKFGHKHAFISVFFFMATSTFYTELLGLNRQMIGELFFVLLLYFVLVSKKMNKFQRVFSFIILGFGLVVSHYALAEIFLFFIAFVFMCSWIFRRRSNNLTAEMFALFFTIMFLWYIFTSNASVFDSFLEFGDYVVRQLGEFFNIEAREKTVLRGLGLEAPPTFWNAMSRVFAYITEFLIVIGFFIFMFNKKEINSKWEHSVLVVGAMGYLIALILIPGLSSTLNMTRFYHVLLFLLAPLCALGGDFLIKLLFRRESRFTASILLLIVLVPYFLFQSGFVYEIVRSDSWSIPLSRYRMNPSRLYGHFGYTNAYNVHSAQWLSENVNVRDAIFYSDPASIANELISYARIIENKYTLSNTTKFKDTSIVYLSTLNIIHEFIFSERLSWNISELSFILDDLSVVYANGASKIYKHSP